MARSVIFVNNDPADWVLDELDGRVVPGSGTLDVTAEISDDELMHAIQVGLGTAFKDDPDGRYLRINGIDRTADASRDGPPIAEATNLLPGLMSSHDHVHLTNAMNTGLVTGGEVSINVDPTKIDIAGGEGQIIDSYTNPLDPTYHRVVWSAKIGIVLTNLATVDATYIALDLNGNVVQKTSDFTNAERRDLIVLGIAVHYSRVAVSSVSMTPVAVYNRHGDLVDFVESFGPLNLEGNVFGPNGANLRIDKTSGKTFRLGVNYSADKKVPSISPDPALTAPFFRHAYRDGAGGWDITTSQDIDPDNWDDGDGVLEPVTAGWWTIHRIFFFPSTNAVAVLYPQYQYETEEEAIDRLDRAVALWPGIEFGTFRGWLVVQQGCTDLSDTDKAQFFPAGKFGLATIIAGAGVGEANTASNVGSAGTGLFKQKAGLDLEFHKLSSASAAIAVAYDAGTDTVRLTFSLPSHASTHEGGSDPISAVGIGAEPTISPKNTAFNKDFGSVAGTVCEGNDVRLSDARTPLSHKDTHKFGGGDAFTASDLIDAVVRRFREAGGPTDLLLGAIADTYLLQRSGTGIVGASPATIVGSYPPQGHKDSHKSGGGDAFTSADLLEAVIRRLRETGGPTDLLLGAISDGQYLRRSGTGIVGATPPGGVTISQATATTTATTTATSDTLMSGMTLTPGAGDYLVFFSSSVGHGTSDGQIYASIYQGTTKIAHSERWWRRGGPAADIVTPLASCAYLAGVGATDAIQIQWRTLFGTASVYQRSLTIVKVA